MKFDKNGFNDGLNVTVRRGKKWHDKLEINEDFMVNDKTATVIGKMVAPIMMLDNGILKYEHDERARNYWGLRKILQDIYDETIYENRIVSVIFFEIAIIE